MKIIHTSDWHLGARFHNEERSEEHRAFLNWLLEKLKEVRPDALIVAGDVFDVKAPSPAAQKMYYRFLADVARSGCCRKVVVTAGNHDNAHLLAAPAEVLEGIGVSVVAIAQGGDDAANEIVVIEDGAGSPGLVIGAVPFMYSAELANFGSDETDEGDARAARIARGWERHYSEVFAKAEAAAPNAPVVLTGHCMLAKATFSDDESERCRAVGGLDAYAPEPLAQADYVALGHLHRPQAVAGFEEKMFYSGSPLPMSFDEAGDAKSICVVTFGGKGERPTVEKCVVPQTVPILTIQDEPKEVKRELRRIVDGDRSSHRFVRVRLQGFEGSADSHWNEIRDIVKNSATLILDEEDMRPPERPPKTTIGGRTIDHVPPREMAELKLRQSSAHYSDEEVGTYMNMFDEVAGGVL